MSCFTPKRLIGSIPKSANSFAQQKILYFLFEYNNKIATKKEPVNEIIRFSFCIFDLSIEESTKPYQIKINTFAKNLTILSLLNTAYSMRICFRSRTKA